jgi:hypothetical protein
VVIEKRKRVFQFESAEWWHLTDQRNALWALIDGDATPAQELEAKAAIVEYAPQFCKAAGAMKHYKTCGSAITFEAPSMSQPGVVYLTTFNRATGAFCNCPAHGNCWHLDAATQLARLLAIVEAESTQNGAFEPAASVCVPDAPTVDYLAYFEGM